MSRLLQPTLRRRPLIPFRWMPASWGLVGDVYLEAEAHYSLHGEELDRRLLDIRFKDDPARLERESLEVDLRYHRISEYEAATRRVELIHPPGIERQLALLEVEHGFGKLSDNAYHKQCADLKNEPWICIVNSGFDPSQGVDGVFFEFDWNQQWITFLITNGYSGRSDEQVIDEWFADVCRSQHLSVDGPVPFSVSPVE